MQVIINLTSKHTADWVDDQADLSAVRTWAVGVLFCHAASSNIYFSKTINIS